MTGLLIGRWQTLHAGHDWLVEQVRKRGLTPCILVRDTQIDQNNPLPAETRVANLRRRYPDAIVQVIPDIQGVYYGRNVGYHIEELKPPLDIRAISGRKIRRDRMANR